MRYSVIEGMSGLRLTSVVLLLTACAGGPVSGDYEVSYELLADTCAMYQDHDFEVEVWRVVFHKDDTVDFDYDGNGDDTECVLSGQTVVCEWSAEQEIQGTGAWMTTEVNASLDWSTNTAFEGAQDIYWSCTSGDCDTLSDYLDVPCDATIGVSGVIVE